jgi:PAS domain S-box-containing protein
LEISLHGPGAASSGAAGFGGDATPARPGGGGQLERHRHHGPNLPDNPIVYVNPAFERISGYAVEESIGRNCRFLQGEDRDQPVLEELRAGAREERECRVVLRNYRKDGELFWNELYISPVHDEAGRLTNFVGVQNDITERRRIEEILRESEERFGRPSNTPP